MTRMIAIALMTAAVGLTSNAAFAESKTKKVNASREQVAAACESSGGFGWGTAASSGSYGCMTDNAWIDCDEDGSCEGGTASRAGSRKPAFRAGRVLRLTR